jgi:peptidyl-prolyl cis-trans isomerase SurA
MNRILVSLFSLLLVATLLVATAPPLRAQALALDPVDGIVAVVDEDVILRSELDRAVANIRTQFADRADQLPPPAVLERQVLERLIMMRLQLQRAESAGVRISDLELEQAISRIAQQNNLTLDQLRTQLANDGSNYDEFRQQLREELTAQRLRQSIIQSRVSVNDTEVDIALASESMKQGQIRVGLILVGLPDGATPEQIQTAQTKIEGVRKLIDSGEMDFNAAAIRYSDHQTALEGGDLGWRSYDEIPPLFANVVQGMSAGEVSQPIRGPSGYSLLKLVETREQTEQKLTEYNARGILIRTTEVVDDAQARAKIEALHARLVAGEDFAKIARENSDDTSTRNGGGDMGWFPLQAWGTAVAEALQTLNDGQLSAPFSTEAGWHIIERLGVREQDVTEEARRNAARETIGRRKADEEFESFMRQLKDEAYIENRLAPA